MDFLVGRDRFFGTITVEKVFLNLDPVSERQLDARPTSVPPDDGQQSPYRRNPNVSQFSWKPWNAWVDQMLQTVLTSDAGVARRSIDSVFRYASASQIYSMVTAYKLYIKT